MSTAGLASAVHVNFTIQPRHILLVVSFAIKLILAGLTAERQKGKLKEDLQRIEIYVKFILRYCLFYASFQLSQDGVPLHRRHSRQKIFMDFSHEVLWPSYLVIIFLFIIELPKTWMIVLKILEKSVRLKQVLFSLFSMIHNKTKNMIFRLQLL